MHVRVESCASYLVAEGGGAKRLLAESADHVADHVTKHGHPCSQPCSSLFIYPSSESRCRESRCRGIPRRKLLRVGGRGAVVQERASRCTGPRPVVVPGHGLAGVDRTGPEHWIRQRGLVL